MQMNRGRGFFNFPGSKTDTDTPFAEMTERTTNDALPAAGKDTNPKNK